MVDVDRVELETDTTDALKEWEDWKWFIGPNHSKLIQQLKQRKKDPNLSLEVRVVEPSQNLLVRYLVVDGSHNRTHMVLFREMSGRVREIWVWDMGLGKNGGDFGVLTEDEYDAMMLEAEE